MEPLHELLNDILRIIHDKYMGKKFHKFYSGEFQLPWLHDWITASMTFCQHISAVILFLNRLARSLICQLTSEFAGPGLP